MGVNRKALELRVVYKKPYFLLQVTQVSVSVLQVMRESVSGTTVTCTASEFAILSQAIPGKNHSFVAIGIVTRAAHS